MSTSARDPFLLVLPVIAAGFAVAIGWSWGLVAMVAGALGALATGLVAALHAGSGSVSVLTSVPPASGRPLSGSGVRIDGDTALARAVAATARAGKSTGTAGVVFVDRDSDAEAVAALEPHLSGGPAGPARPIVAQIRDPALRQALRDRFEADNLRPLPVLFGLATVLARETIGRARLYEQAYWRDQPRLHAVILGFGAMGRACLDEAVFAGIAGQLAPPRITIVDPHPEAVRGFLRREMPELHLSADIAVAAYDAATLTDAEGGTLAAAEEASPLTAILICLADDMDRVTAMGAIARAQRHGRAMAPIIVLSDERSVAALLARPPQRGPDMARRVVVEGGCPADLDLIERLTTGEDAIARRLHEAYRETFGGTGRSSVPWEALPESFRTANRAAARHLPQKLWTAGLTAASTTAEPGDVAPEAFASIVEPCSTSTGEDALMRRLARLEHDRWCADRRLDGWSYGSGRDDERRLHPSLVSFDDPRFTDAEIAKDIGQIRFLFGAVARAAPGGATAPIVIGVTPASGPRGGIAIGDALALLARETWRPVLLLCALADAAEVATIDTLVLALRAGERSFKLLVPEPRSLDPGGRAAATTAGPRLDALLRLPETTIVPIAGGEARHDGWADPEALADLAPVTNSYIERRATAIVEAVSAAAAPAAAGVADPVA